MPHGRVGAMRPDEPIDGAPKVTQNGPESGQPTRHRGGVPTFYDVWDTLRDKDDAAAAFEVRRYAVMNEKTKGVDPTGMTLSSVWALWPETKHMPVLGDSKPGSLSASSHYSHSLSHVRQEPTVPPLSRLLRSPGNTLAHLAVARGAAATLDALAKYGAKLNALNHDGHTPLALARDMRQSACAAALERAAGGAAQPPPSAPFEALSWDTLWLAVREKDDAKAWRKPGSFSFRVCVCWHETSFS